MLARHGYGPGATTPNLTVPALPYPIERATLVNGLRVVIAPDSRAPAIAVTVYYDVGIRSEPEGRTGFAHLFEHLMFQGSASLEKLAHSRYVHSSGGDFDGTTHLDYTNFYEILPSNALERALFLEADRMRAPRLTEQNLANQIAVVKEEVRLKVMNQAYGGFPWLQLPPVLFDTFPNAHNGYGDFADLEGARIEDAQGFFDRYYAPGNAVLAVVGDLDVAETLRLIERHFGDIPARPVPERPSFAEPDLDGPRHDRTVDRHAPMPAVALGWRVPDPITDFGAYLPYLVLSVVLTDGDASRLRRRLVKDDRLVTALSAFLSVMGDPFDVREPSAMVVSAIHTRPVEDVLVALDEELDRLATDGLVDGELERARVRLVVGQIGRTEPLLDRARLIAVLEQQRGRAELAGELPGLLAEVTGEQVVKAAAMLRPDRRAVLELVPGGRK
ncbi:MAG: M16 family metallopeptidase [Egibacteraceae bacterium]